MTFLMALLKNVHTYIYIILLTIIGTLNYQNNKHINTIEDQAKSIEKEVASRLRLENKVKNQNDEVNKLKAETDQLKTRVESSIITIEFLDEEGNKVLMELDEQSIPKEHRGALMWMIQKSMEELKQ